VTGRVMLAVADAGNHLATGLVCTQASLERSRYEIAEYGWIVAATVPHYSRGRLRLCPRPRRGCRGWRQHCG
jgi:hypothetical protein